MMFPFFTFGGMFYWFDKHSYAGWRIQENIWTRRCRLLDPYDVRRANGDFDICYEKLLYFLKAWEVPQPPKKAVVFIHGLYQKPFSFEKMARAFSSEYEIILFSYPTLRYDVMKAAKALNTLLNRRLDISKINFVAQGVGGLILRQAIALNPEWLVNIGRSVMIGVPNQGYRWAEKRKDGRLYHFFFGELGKEMAPHFVQKEIPPMVGEFGVIMGGKEDNKGFSPFFKEDNDGILRASEASHPGSKEEYLALNKTHFFLHKDEKVIEMTYAFIDHGRFGRGIRIRKEQQNLANIWDK